MNESRPFVSRGGLKLDAALEVFTINPKERVCCDLGCSTGGFTDVLLRRGAAKVFAVDTGYGVLDWTLRNDDRVVVMERTNAMHVELPEPVGLVVIDAGWTRQRKVLPNAKRLLRQDGDVVTLVKPHYEIDKSLLPPGGIVPDDRLDNVLADARQDVEAAGFNLVAECESPILGSSKRSSTGNREFLWHLRPNC
jgi:23S rRNA (cytidine1920-2'-O)/16S rRNA (cytidine1409-2'-O)-methyltransferase